MIPELWLSYFWQRYMMEAWMFYGLTINFHCLKWHECTVIVKKKRNGIILNRPKHVFSALGLVFILGSIQADTSTSVIGWQHHRPDASVGLYPVHRNKIVCEHIQSSNYIFGKHKRESTAVIHCVKVICWSQGCKTTPAHMLGSCGFFFFFF